MYEKKPVGWRKHLDFILLDFLCIHIALILADLLRFGSAALDRVNLYGTIALVISLTFMVVVFFHEGYKNILKRGYYLEFAELLNRSDLLTADGIGVVHASKILKKPIKERAAGFDIAKKVLEKMNYTDHKLFLFGGKPGVAEEAARNLKKDYPELNIAGMRNGYFKEGEEPEIVEEINASGADMLFVCLGAPKQEQWIDRNREGLKNVRVAMGIGGSLDVFAGNVQRAPEIFCKTGMEWFYRLCKEPWRAKRMADLPKFAATVITKGKNYKQD